MYPLPPYIKEWDKDALLFFFVIFKKAVLSLNVNYVNKFTRDMAKSIVIKLPSHDNETPDFSLMRSMIRNFQNESKKLLEKRMNLCDIPKTKIYTETWGEFSITDFFVVDTGTKLDKVKMRKDNPQVNFVGRSNQNNGITCIVNKIQGLEPYKAGTLTLALGGEYLGSCFVQPEPFYTSQNVDVLIPKENLSWNAKQFIATCIFKESQLNYKAFIKELNAHVKTDFSFKLPTNSDGQPDFAYMEETIRTLSTKVDKHFALLNEVVK